MQLVELREDYEKFESLGAQILAVSTDDLSQAEFAVEKLGLQFPVLQDPEGRVSTEYKVFNLLNDGRLRHPLSCWTKMASSVGNTSANPSLTGRPTPRLSASCRGFKPGRGPPTATSILLILGSTTKQLNWGGFPLSVPPSRRQLPALGLTLGEVGVSFEPGPLLAQSGLIVNPANGLAGEAHGEAEIEVRYLYARALAGRQESQAATGRSHGTGSCSRRIGLPQLLARRAPLLPLRDWLRISGLGQQHGCPHQENPPGNRRPSTASTPPD